MLTKVRHPHVLEIHFDFARQCAGEAGAVKNAHLTYLTADDDDGTVVADSYRNESPKHVDATDPQIKDLLGCAVVCLSQDLDASRQEVSTLKASLAEMQRKLDAVVAGAPAA